VSGGARFQGVWRHFPAFLTIGGALPTGV
jgi:hypothetical protein